MARGRLISNVLSVSEKFAALTPLPLGEFCQALYPLLVSHTDDFGRLQGDAFTVKAKCFPASRRSLEEFQMGLRHMHEVGLIVWYAVDSKRYIQIWNFDSHQPGLHKRTKSALPEVPGNSRNLPEDTVSVPSVPSELNRREEKGTERKGTEEKASGGIARGPYRTDPIIGRDPHREHVFCDKTFSYCVPRPVHQKLVACVAPRYGNDADAGDTAMRQWYPTVTGKLVDGFVMGDAFKFWQGRFDAEFATPDAPKARQRLTEDGDAMVAGVREILKRQGAL